VVDFDFKSLDKPNTKITLTIKNLLKWITHLHFTVAADFLLGFFKIGLVIPFIKAVRDE